MMITVVRIGVISRMSGRMASVGWGAGRQEKRGSRGYQGILFLVQGGHYMGDSFINVLLNSSSLLNVSVLLMK